MRKEKQRWLRKRSRNVNGQTSKRPRTASKVKRINHLKKLERKGYFDE